MPVQFILFSAQINKVHHLFLSTKDYTEYSAFRQTKMLMI